MLPCYKPYELHLRINNRNLVKYRLPRTLYPAPGSHLAPGSLGESVEQLHDFAQTIRARARATRTHGYAMERATATLWNTIGRAIFVARPSVSSPIWL